MPDLDLEDGDEVRAEASPAERRRLAREAAEGKVRSGDTGRPATKAAATRAKTAAAHADSELRGKLDRAFDRIAKMLEKREDFELAQAIREDSDQMAEGLVSLTSGVKFLRSPLVFVLNVVEPVLAFGRIARILLGRWQDRAARRQYEHEQQGDEVVEGVVVNA